MTNDDPHDRTRTVAAEEQPAGEQTPARAELLGSTALTARVRCPCGKRQDVDREDWQWNGVATCSRCGRGILDHSLHVISRGLALAMIEQRRPTEGELRALRRMELSLRDFMPRYDEFPRWYWSPPTNRMADEVRQLIADLDESRRDRGAPPVVASGRSFLDEDDEGESAEAGVGDADEEEYDEEDDDDDLDEGDE
jgi:hypothetical protein